MNEISDKMPPKKRKATDQGTSKKKKKPNLLINVIFLELHENEKRHTNLLSKSSWRIMNE